MAADVCNTLSTRDEKPGAFWVTSCGGGGQPENGILEEDLMCPGGFRVRLADRILSFKKDLDLKTH